MERVTITLTPDLASRVKAAVETGNYGSVSEVMRQALLERELAEARRAQELKTLRDDVAIGIKQAKAGKARPFDPVRIVRTGERLAAKKR